jgi:hypothetical protein
LWMCFFPQCSITGKIYCGFSLLACFKLLVELAVWH